MSYFCFCIHYTLQYFANLISHKSTSRYIIIFIIFKCNAMLSLLARSASDRLCWDRWTEMKITNFWKPSRTCPIAFALVNSQSGQITRVAELYKAASSEQRCKKIQVAAARQVNALIKSMKKKYDLLFLTCHWHGKYTNPNVHTVVKKSMSRVVNDTSEIKLYTGIFYFVYVKFVYMLKKFFFF